MGEPAAFSDRVRRVFGVWTRLAAYVRPQARRLRAAAVFSLLAVGFELAKPWPLKVVVDQVILGMDQPALPGWLRGDALLLAAIVATIAFATFVGVGAFFRDVLLAEAGQRAVNAVRRDALDAVLRQSLAWHERNRSGDLLVRLCGDAQSLRLLLVEGVFSLGREGLLVVGTLVVMTWVDWRLALAAVVVLPAIAGLSAIFSLRLRTAARKQRRKEGMLATSAHEALAAVPVIQAYGLQESAVASFAGQSRRSARAGREATRLEGRLAASTEVTLAVGAGFVLWLGVERVRAGMLSPGELIVLLAYVRSLYRPIRKALGRGAAMVKAAASAERVLALLRAEPDLAEPVDPVPMPTARGELLFRGVCVGYAGHPLVIDHLDLHIRPGEHVALVGANGTGKTTLATLLPRLRDPDAGSVELDGVDLRRLDLATVRRHVAMVFQESVLLDGTLLENLLVARPDATTQELHEAARRAGVLTFAQDLPLGLETRVGARGAALSGGERQRVALARAILRNAAVYVFDEPTNGLDAAAVAQLREVVLPALAGRTVIVITHDVQLLDCFDRVVHLGGGRVHREGCHPRRALEHVEGGRR
ncbi:ABC transporter ATP-binding protein [Opitutales bacterium ASA1]|uniref:ABC transporter ATP-binding protein n=1 Tax=Congregicoccus parvus TaxID=3081749 RepID=UPI002B2D0244|nr:ABC transporter ATP-binding protein [Opitutales bacterium ASA1]